MRLTRHLPAATLSVAALALALGGCGAEHDEEEAFREGLTVDVGGIDYNVYITRQLNPNQPPDSDFTEGTNPDPKGELYGVFLTACNISEGPRTPTEEFVVKDSQDNRYAPVELPESNRFAFHPRSIQPDECIPAPGSAGTFNPTGGAMLLYELPLAATENRPLELEIEAGGESKQIELDI